jgi:nitrile hydratase
MNGVHDMGGMHGFGPVQPEDNEPVFHSPWEARMFGMALALGPQGIHDPEGLRNSLEHMEPSEYLSFSYYRRWLEVTEQALMRKGLLTSEELEAKTAELQAHPDTEAPRIEDPELRQRMVTAIYRPSPPHKDIGVVPRFQPGDHVTVSNVHSPAHTRLPGYVKGKRGIIDRFHGVHDFHDVLPEGQEAQPQPVYSVRFTAGELWGESAEANQSVYLDMWESYLTTV